MKKKLKIVYLLILSFCIYFGITSIGIYHFSKQDETRKSDVAIVLGASIWNDQPSPVFKERINHAIKIYNAGYVNKIIFTGGITDGNNYSESSVAKKYAELYGIPSKDIFIEEKSTITQENLFYTKKIMQQHALSNALIVSDPLHLKRALLIAKDQNITCYSSPTRTSKYHSKSAKLKFLLRETFFYIAYQFYSIIK